jgi:hypothetical protein
MDIYINDNMIDATLEDERTVGDVLEAVERDCESQNATIVEIEIDGRVLAASEIDSESAKEIDGIHSLKLRVVSESDIAGAFAGLGEEFSRLERELPDVPALMQGGKKSEAYGTIQNLADAIDTFCRLTAFSALFPDRFSLVKIDGASPQEFFEDFSPVLSGFRKALEDNDIVMIGDLAEYEIAPRISAISALLARTEESP